MTNQVVARALIRRLIAGRSFCRSFSTASKASASSAAVIVRPYDEAAVTWRGHVWGFTSGGGAEWRMTREMSTVAEAEKDGKKDREGAEAKGEKGEVMVSSYWGISRPKLTRDDGTEWPWNCFMPWETYRSDMSIDLGKHHVPKTFLDKVAYRTVKLL